MDTSAMLPRMEEGETSDFSDVQPLMSGESSTARRFPARALAGVGILLIGIVALYPKSQGAAPSLAAVHESIGLIDYVNYTAEDCKPYMIEPGCGWTELYSCEGQSPGTSGNAGDDGTLGYSCCCKQQMWEQVEASTPAPTFALIATAAPTVALTAAPTQVSDAPTKPAPIALICVALFGLLAIVGAILFCFCAGGRKKSGMNDQNASSATTRTLIQTSRDEDRQAPISRCPRWLKQVFCCCCYPRRKTAPGPLRQQELATRDEAVANLDGLEEALSKLAVLRNQAPQGAGPDENVMLVLADIHSQAVQAQRLLSAPASEYGGSMQAYSVASRASVPRRRERSNRRGSRGGSAGGSKERYVGDGGFGEYDSYARRGGQRQGSNGDYYEDRRGDAQISTYYEDEDNQYQQADDARNISTSPDYYRDRDRERDERARRHRDKDRQRQRDRDAGVERDSSGREARDSDRDRSRDRRRTSPSRDGAEASLGRESEYPLRQK